MTTFAVLAAAPADPEKGARTWLQIMAAGDFTDPRYGDFSITTALMDEIVANFEALPNAVPLDYDHSLANGGGTRAAGWVYGLERRGTELWAEVALTAAAVQAVRDGEFRFLSPEFTTEYIDKHGTSIGAALLAVALTNRPFLTGMQEITLTTTGGVTETVYLSVSTPSQEPPEEADMTMQEVCRALGISEDSDGSVVLSTIRDMRAVAPGDSIVLTTAEHAALTEAAEAGARALEAHRDHVLDQAITDGRLAPALRDVMLTAWAQDPDGTEQALAQAPAGQVFTPIGAGTTGEADGEGTYSDRLDREAQRLMSGQPGLSYRDALGQAAKTVKDDRAHVGAR